MLSSQRVGELNALPYSTSPFAAGIRAEDMRIDMHAYGERVIWLRAAEMEGGPDGQTPQTGAGKVYVAQVLAPEVRVFLYQNMRELETQTFALMERGNTMISFMPDEIDPIRDDRFIALDRTLTSRETLAPGTDNARALPHSRIVSIDAVWGAGTRYDAAQYNVTETGLSWTGAAPTGEVEVIYRYTPSFEWLGDNTYQAFLGTDGVRLPGRGPLRLLSAGEEI